MLQEPPAVRRDRTLAAYLGAVTLAQMGDAAWLVALGWTAVHSFSPGVAGLVVGIGTLPQAVLMVAGGVLADRGNTRRILVAGYLARALVLVTGGLVWWHGLATAWVLAGVALVLGAVAGLTQPASTTMGRQLVRVDDLPVIGGWLQVGGRLARLTGAPLGAVLVSQVGLVAAMTLAGAGYLLLAGVVAGVQPRFALPRATEAPVEALRDGLVYLRDTAEVRHLVLGIACLNVFIAPALALALPLRVSSAGWGALWLGVSEATFAVGAIAGSVLAMRWRPEPLGRSGFRALVVQGAGIVALGVPWLPSVLVGACVIGVTAGLASVWISSVMTALVSPRHLGRVTSVATLGDLLLIPAAMPLVGLLAAATSVGVATAACGAGMVLWCLVAQSRPAIAGARLTPDLPSSHGLDPAADPATVR